MTDVNLSQPDGCGAAESLPFLWDPFQQCMSVCDGAMQSTHQDTGRQNRVPVTGPSAETNNFCREFLVQKRGSRHTIWRAGGTSLNQR
jgi:hypothetical protein